MLTDTGIFTVFYGYICVWNQRAFIYLHWLQDSVSLRQGERCLVPLIAVRVAISDSHHLEGVSKKNQQKPLKILGSS